MEIKTHDRWIPRGVSFQRPRHRLIDVASLGRLSRNRSIPVCFTRYPRTALSDRWRSLGITSLMNIGGIRYVHIHSYITEVNGEEKPLCVICSKILAADSMKPNKLKRHFETLHAIEIVETMFGDNFAKELQSIPLSNDTVSRRIDDIAEDVKSNSFSDNLIASYEWVRDPFQNTPEGFSTTEEESFIDFTSSGEIKRQFCNKTLSILSRSR
ncbi:hypothetical protein TNCV_1566731 [Trichonephila clavipes]|nr:hypothetical protein TNCV_1566731 [Trichonephila clavipes]